MEMKRIKKAAADTSPEGSMFCGFSRKWGNRFDVESVMPELVSQEIVEPESCEHGDSAETLVVYFLFGPN